MGGHQMIDQTRIAELFVYRDGQLFWTTAGPKRLWGKRAGTVTGKGYRQVKVSGRFYPEHRVIFMLYHGYVPRLLDHINGVRDDNRIENLRPCSQQENMYNTDGWSRHDLPKGVTWHKGGRKYQAQLSINGRNKYLGQYDSAEAAAERVREERTKHHGEFAKH
jgi:hypothetical protein